MNPNSNNLDIINVNKHVSKNVYSFTLSIEQGYTILTAGEYPWTVLQVVPATPDTFDDVVEKCETQGFVAIHNTDRTFCIIQLSSGDQGGKYPERHIEICGQESARRYLDGVKDSMAQAAVWYYTNVVAPSGF